MNRQSGFTLVETLIASALAAIVSIALITMLSSSLKATGNSGNKINFLNFTELLNDRLQYPTYCSAHIGNVPFDFVAAQAIDPLTGGMPISFDLSHDGLGILQESSPLAPVKIPSYGLTIDRVRLTSAKLITENTVAGVAQDITRRYNTILTLQATLDSGLQIHKPIGSFTISVRLGGVIKGCERNTNMDIENCAANNKIYMPYPIPGTDPLDPMYQPDQYGCISPNIIATALGPVIPGPTIPGPVIPGPFIPGPVLPGPVLPGPIIPVPVPVPVPSPKPSDKVLKKDLRVLGNQAGQDEQIFQLINTFKKQNQILQELQQDIEIQKRTHEKK